MMRIYGAGIVVALAGCGVIEGNRAPVAAVDAGVPDAYETPYVDGWCMVYASRWCTAQLLCAGYPEDLAADYCRGLPEQHPEEPRMWADMRGYCCNILTDCSAYAEAGVNPIADCQEAADGLSCTRRDGIRESPLDPVFGLKCTWPE